VHLLVLLVVSLVCCSCCWFLALCWHLQETCWRSCYCTAGRRKQGTPLPAMTVALLLV
jgi:hypothetical protein